MDAAQLELIAFHQQKSYFACGSVKKRVNMVFQNPRIFLPDKITTPKDRMALSCT
jgi:hypothetical protein